jgi:hypothetical protein
MTFFTGGILLASQKPWGAGGVVTGGVWFVLAVLPQPLRKITVERSAAVEPLDREAIMVFSKGNCSTPEQSEALRRLVFRS